MLETRLISPLPKFLLLLSFAKCLFYILKLMQNKVDELKTEQSIHSQKNIK